MLVERGVDVDGGGISWCFESWMYASDTTACHLVPPAYTHLDIWGEGIRSSTLSWRAKTREAYGHNPRGG